MLLCEVRTCGTSTEGSSACGINDEARGITLLFWIPAFAGMTNDQTRNTNHEWLVMDIYRLKSGNSPYIRPIAGIIINSIQRIACGGK